LQLRLWLRLWLLLLTRSARRRAVRLRQDNIPTRGLDLVHLIPKRRSCTHDLLDSLDVCILALHLKSALHLQHTRKRELVLSLRFVELVEELEALVLELSEPVGHGSSDLGPLALLRDPVVEGADVLARLGDAGIRLLEELEVLAILMSRLVGGELVNFEALDFCFGLVDSFNNATRGDTINRLRRRGAEGGINLGLGTRS
jgi:hypothetical protein